MKGERRVRLKAGQRDQHKTDANVKGRERAGKRTDGHGARPPATAREGRTRGASPTGAQRGGSRHQPQPRERPRMGSRSPREPDEAPRRPTVPPDPGDGRATPPGVFKPTRRNATIQVPGQGRGGQDTRDAGTGQNGAPPPQPHRPHDTRSAEAGAWAEARGRGTRRRSPTAQRSAPLAGEGRAGRERGTPAGHGAACGAPGREGAREDGQSPARPPRGPDGGTDTGPTDGTRPTHVPLGPRKPANREARHRPTHATRPRTRDAPPGERKEEAGPSGRKPLSVNDPSAGSPTETLLRLLLPLDSQVRPSSQRSARAVGRPRRGRSEGLTKPSNR